MSDTGAKCKYDLEALRNAGKPASAGYFYDQEADETYGIKRYRSLSREPESTAEIVAWEVYDALHTHHHGIRFETDERTVAELLDWWDGDDGFPIAETVTVDSRSLPEMSYCDQKVFARLVFSDSTVSVCVCRRDGIDHKHYDADYADPYCFEKLAALLVRGGITLDLEALP